MEKTSQKTLKHNLDSIQQKARERTVKTQNAEYDLDTLIKRIDNKTIKLDPDYQRRHRWSNETSSRLIESLILNIPIPVIFISQDVDVDEEVFDSASRFTVIDGQQRLTAIHDFIKNKLRLEGLETLSELNGSYYKDLPPFLTRRLEERTVKCLRIDSTVDAQVKFDIFERLNTGSVQLESQELRNATARGPFNDAIKEWAKFPEFRKLIQVDSTDPESNSKVKKMEDVELVLRFFALRHGGHEKIKKGFKEFLTSSLVELNSLSPEQIERSGDDFKTYISFLFHALGAQAFSKWKVEADGMRKMSNFNAAVYDALAVGLSNAFSVGEIHENGAEIAQKVQGFRKVLFADEDFFDAISGSVNDAAKVEKRIAKMSEFLRA